MNTLIPRVSGTLTLMLLLVFSAQANALALKKAEVRSSLNQPLAIKIPILGTVAELGSLQVRLRTKPDSGSALPPGLRHEIVKEGDDPHLLLTTPRALSEPYVRFVLEAAWSGGKMVRDYEFLIDLATPRR